MTRQEYLLTKLMEECCEVAQETAKAKLFGVHEQRDLPTSNRERMQKEYNDVLAIVDMLNLAGVTLYRDEALIAAKKEKVERYMRYSRECGTLQDEAAT